MFPSILFFYIMKDVRMQHKKADRPDMAIGERSRDALGPIRATAQEYITYGRCETNGRCEYDFGVRD